MIELAACEEDAMEGGFWGVVGGAVLYIILNETFDVSDFSGLTETLGVL